MKYDCFHLVLMVTHQCNLQCGYCYMGRHFPRSMSFETGQVALCRAIRSIESGGVLELGFFGGEPLLEAELVAELADEAQRAAESARVALQLGLTTNGTQHTGKAWDVMLRPDLDLCVSHDGLPEMHNRFRRRSDGSGDALQVSETIRRLQDAGRMPRVVTVVRPESAEFLPQSVQWIFDRGVEQIDLTLDVWADWRTPDVERLEQSLAAAADLWRAGLPDRSINWFDEKTAHLAGVPIEPTARCRFGDGEIAVSPSGNLYPCERLIGEDRPDQPLRLPGHALEGEDFCGSPSPSRSAEACRACAIQGQCNTTCRCNNFVRTGDPTRPDALLCLLDRVCYRETARVLCEQRKGTEAVVESHPSNRKNIFSTTASVPLARDCQSASPN
jgi:uncharacterized protein